MSYDLMVFREDAAPRNRIEFMKWYGLQTSWKETHGYNNPAVTSPELQKFLIEMTEYFPAMNGQFKRQLKTGSNTEADYTIGAEVIYITFDWSFADAAYKVTKSLAEKYRVGFFDVSADDGEIIIPGMDIF